MFSLDFDSLFKTVDLKGMFLKVRNGEWGTGNREPEFGKEFTAVVHMRSQNG